MEHLKQTWTLTPDQVLEALDTPPETGLSQAEAARRLAEHGPNELIEQGLEKPVAHPGRTVHRSDGRRPHRGRGHLLCSSATSRTP